MTCTLADRRALLHRGLALAAALAAPRTAHLQTNNAVPPIAPATLRLLCSGPAGSIPDTIARRYAQALSERYAGGVMVDNKVGAAGQLAVAALKQALPSGGTLLLAQGAVATVYPSLYARLAYDPVADLKPVSMAAEATLALAVGPAVPDSVATLAELVAWLKRNPQQANYGSPGIGTLPHLLGAAFLRAAEVEAQHVPYPGGPAALVDLIGGRLPLLVLPEGMLRQHQASARLRVLATSGSGRSDFLPAVASFVEQGFPALVVREWFAFFAPGATPPAVVEAASVALRQAAAQTLVSGALADSGMAAVASTPAALAERIAIEQRYWQGVLRATGIRAE